MAAVESSVKDALLNFALTELSRSATNHVYDFVKSELGSSRHHMLAASILAKESLKSVPVQQKEQTPKPGADYESLISCNETDFKKLFRMSRKTVYTLVRVIEKRLSASPESIHPLVPVEKKVLLTTWLMGNNQSYMSAAKLFEISKGTVYRVFHQICSELTILAGKYVRWPDPEECDEISASFESKYGFPGIIGVIDACHIEIREPESAEEGSRFKNEQTGLYTVILQAVSDDKLLFRDVSAGFPGQTSKSRVLVGSPLYAKLTSRTEPLIEPHKHIIGSCDYPQLSTLLTPYSASVNGPQLSKHELKFNTLHEEARSVIDQAFELLTKRFHRLRFIDVSRTELASKVVVAACVLHNFAIIHGDAFREDQM